MRDVSTKKGGEGRLNRSNLNPVSRVIDERVLCRPADYAGHTGEFG